MANVHTDLPTKKGERELAQRLEAIDDPALHLWFALDHIPGVQDIDVLLLHERAGFFVIEVKAVPLRMIRTYGQAHCDIEGRNDERSAHMQASDARYKLKELLDRELKRSPRIEATACFPLITRREWRSKFGPDSQVGGVLANGLLFDCDVSAGAEAFEERLRTIWFNPPAKVGAKFRFQCDATLIKHISSVVAPVAQGSIGAPSDYDRLRAIEKVVETHAQKDAPPDKCIRLLYTGYPGTGKTFRLLAIGMSHALAGKRVLYVCFNKTLAADISRILLLSDQLRVHRAGGDVVFEVFDISEMARRYAEGEEASYSEWLSQALAHAKEISELPSYDLILVDEVQDMPEAGLRLLDLHAWDMTSICVAAGTGQELYGEASEWLEDFQTDPRTKELLLRRVFRNTKPIHQLAQLFYESELSIEQARRIAGRYKGKQKQQGELQFDRPEGEWPIVLDIDDSKLDWSQADSTFFAEDLTATMVRRYEEVIGDQVDALTARETPMDILVLVPAFRSLERGWAVTALDRVTKRQSIRFLDYTDEANRRQPGHPDFIRLCTFASARGIEGYRTVVCGFEGLERLCTETSQALRNLGYIVLSRSVFQLALVRRLSRPRFAPIEHAVSCIRLLREASLDGT